MLDIHPMETESDYNYVKEYLISLLREFSREVKYRPHSEKKLAHNIWDILTSNDFCYLSKAQAMKYFEPIMNTINRTILHRLPLKMYLDLGPGYHAAIESSGDRCLSFNVGLGELLVLHQIDKYSKRVAEIYEPGVDFYIIIDNLCGYLVNSISIESTQGYCRSLRELIEELSMNNLVTVLVESENFTVADYNMQPLSEELVCSTTLSDDALENVRRFLGYDCGMEEAVRRSLTYQQIGGTTDELFSRFFYDGIHMTQRASKSTICFRAFSGGDSRIQAGQVVLGLSKKNKIYPFLLTSQKYGKYTCNYYRYDNILPKSIKHVIFTNELVEDGVARIKKDS